MAGHQRLVVDKGVAMYLPKPLFKFPMIIPSIDLYIRGLLFYPSAYDPSSNYFSNTTIWMDVDAEIKYYDHLAKHVFSDPKRWRDGKVKAQSNLCSQHERISPWSSGYTSLGMQDLGSCSSNICSAHLFKRIENRWTRPQ